MGTLTIANAGTKSTQLVANREAKLGLQQAASITIFAPAALTGTATVEVAPLPGAVDGSFRVLVLPGGSDFTIAAGDAVTILHPSFGDLRIVSDNSEAAERQFLVTAQMGC